MTPERMTHDQRALFERAAAVAGLAHAAQVDLQGDPYLVHVFRVADRCGDDAEARIVGLLHDTLEDTMVTEKGLREHFPAHVVDAVVLLTREKDDGTYAQYIESIMKATGRAAYLAWTVKLADLHDHLDRMTPEMEAERPDLAKRYRAALKRLTLGRSSR